MNKTVKMIVSLILAVMFLAFLGCRNETTTPNHEQPTQDANASQKPIETEQPTQTIETKPRQPYMAKMGPGRADPAKFTEKDRDYYLSRINQHDFNAVRTFLEIKDGYGIRNGEKMNEWYSPDDPTTWFYSPVNNEPYMSNENYSGYVDLVEWNNGNLVCMNIEPFIQKSDSSNMRFKVGEFIGELDLSNCTSLGKFTLIGSNIRTVNLEGCVGLGKGLYNVYIADATELDFLNLKGTKLKWLSLENLPKLNRAFASVIECSELNLHGMGLKRIDWLCTIGAAATGENLFHMKLDTEGKGLVYPEHVEDVDSYVYLTATPEEGHRFIGWYDSEGKLVWDKERLNVNDFLIDKGTDERLNLKLVAKFE